MKLSEAKEILKKNGCILSEKKTDLDESFKEFAEKQGYSFLNEAKKTVTKVFFKFTKSSLQEIGIDAEELSADPIIGKYIDLSEDPYYIWADKVPVKTAKEWTDKNYSNEDQKEKWNWSLNSIFSNEFSDTVYIYEAGNGKFPDWSSVEANVNTPRYVALAVSTKGLKYEHNKKIANMLYDVGVGEVIDDYEDGYVFGDIPMKGLKQVIARIKVEYPVYGKRLKVFTNGQLSKDITSKFV